MRLTWLPLVGQFKCKYPTAVGKEQNGLLETIVIKMYVCTFIRNRLKPLVIYFLLTCFHVIFCCFSSKWSSFCSNQFSCGSRVSFGMNCLLGSPIVRWILRRSLNAFTLSRLLKVNINKQTVVNCRWRLVRTDKLQNIVGSSVNFTIH